MVQVPEMASKLIDYGSTNRDYSLGFASKLAWDPIFLIFLLLN
jgi:hypothetical protein